MQIGKWTEAKTTLPGNDLHHGYPIIDSTVVSAAYWQDENTLLIQWIFSETAFRDTVKITFSPFVGDKMGSNLIVVLDRSVNVNSKDLPLAWTSLYAYPSSKSKL